MARILFAMVCAYCFACISCSSEGGASSPETSSASAASSASVWTNTGVICTVKDSTFTDAAAGVLYVCDGATWGGAAVSSLSSSSSEVPAASSSSGAESSSSVFVHTPGFDPCRFNFGAGWQTTHQKDTAFYKGMDFISVWLGDNDYFNPSFEGWMLDMAFGVGATPMIYAYVIAEVGKDQNLKDCDMGTPNLCTNGASIIRQYFADSILYRYRLYAEGMRDYIALYYSPKILADTLQMIWLIEPDFYQYSASGDDQNGSSTNQVGGGIPDDSMGIYFSQIVQTIKTYLPAAKIAIDISPWIKDMKGWYANFDMSLVDYASTSGGRTLAGSAKIRSANISTWAGVREIIGKPILADAGYDAGGKGTGQDTTWDNVANLNARIADGVIGVTQMDAASTYSAAISIVRPQLSAIPGCSSN